MMIFPWLNNFLQIAEIYREHNLFFISTYDLPFSRYIYMCRKDKFLKGTHQTSKSTITDGSACSYEAIE